MVIYNADIKCTTHIKTMKSFINKHTDKKNNGTKFSFVP